MAALIKQSNLGDITFGVPGNIEMLNKPWGFYEFLGVPPTATHEELKRAYKRLSLKFHPDHGGNEEDFKRLQMVAEVLLESNAELGQEHSRRTHYNEVSSLDSFFDEYIEFKGERTKKLSEIKLIQMQLGRKEAQLDIEMSKTNPDFAALKNEMNNAHSDKRKAEIAKKLMEIVAKAKGVAQETIEQMEEGFRKSMEQHKAEIISFVDRMNRSPEDYLKKILDLYHIGGGKVEFGTDSQRAYMGLVSYEEQKYMLMLVIGGDCYIIRFPQVHFKSEDVDVKISDPKLQGVFHIVNGSVSINYDRAPDKVIRARASNINLCKESGISETFKCRGDLYIPAKYAGQNWWKRKPALDIAVRNGTITFQQIFPFQLYNNEFIIPDIDKSFGKKGYGNIINTTLEDLIKGSYGDDYKKYK